MILNPYSSIFALSKNVVDNSYCVPLSALEATRHTGTSDGSTLSGNVYRYQFNPGNLTSML